MVRLIVTADDFGRSDGINRAIIESFKYGIVTGASVLITGSSANDAILFAKENPELGIGLHLDLDRFCIIKRPEGIIEGFKQNPIPIKDMIAEARRQIEAFKDAGLTLYHLDSHHHSHLRPEVFPSIIELLKEYGITTIRFSDNYYNDYFNGDYTKYFRQILIERGIITTDYFIARWGEGCLESLPELKSAELMMHPGYPGDDVSLPEWRVKELMICTAPKVKEEIKRKDITLLTFKELQTRCAE